MNPIKLGELSLQCGRCEKWKDQRVVAEYVDTHVVVDESERSYSEFQCIVRLSKCPSCDFLNLSFEDDYGVVIRLYPDSAKELEGLPPKIAKAYKAALAVKIVDANAFAVLLGRVLELVCLDRGAAGDTLFVQLKDLAQKGEIPDRLADLAHQLRLLRNIGAHANLGELTRDEVPILEDICRAILEYVYTAPNLISKVEERLTMIKNNRSV